MNFLADVNIVGQAAAVHGSTEWSPQPKPSAFRCFLLVGQWVAIASCTEVDWRGGCRKIKENKGINEKWDRQKPSQAGGCRAPATRCDTAEGVIKEMFMPRADIGEDVRASAAILWLSLDVFLDYIAAVSAAGGVSPILASP